MCSLLLFVPFPLLSSTSSVTNDVHLAEERKWLTAPGSCCRGFVDDWSCCLSTLDLGGLKTCGAVLGAPPGERLSRDIISPAVPVAVQIQPEMIHLLACLKSALHVIDSEAQMCDMLHHQSCVGNGFLS